MADNLLNSSVTALTTEISNQISTATVDELLDLARAANSIGKDNDTTLETAINTRVGQLLTNATSEDVKKLGDVIKKMSDVVVSSGTSFTGKTTDDLTEGSTNLYFTDARADARITNAIIDEDSFTSNSETQVPTQQSVKSYVDTQITSGSASIELSETAPSSPTDGTMWYNTSDGALYIYYNDGDSSQWVGVSGPAGPAGESGAVTIGDNPPSSPTDGQQWFDSSDGSLYIYYNDGTSSQWVATSGPASVTSTSSSWLEKNANYTVVAGEKLLVDCSGGAKTITLPVSANMGDEIRIIDATGNASTNNITVARNGHKIQGDTQDLTIDTDRAAFGLVYYNSTQGWLLTER